MADKFMPLRAAFKSVFGSTDSQADIAAGALRDLFDLNPGGQLIWQATGKAIDTGRKRGRISKNTMTFCCRPKRRLIRP